MSQTTTLSTVGDALKTVTLQNGKIFSFQSNNSIDLDLIPVIDASRIWSASFEDRQAVAEEIREASRMIGFFYLINHVSSCSNIKVNSNADDTLKGYRREVCHTGNGRSKEILCHARGEENGGLHRTCSERVCRLPSNEMLQPEWLETPR